MRAFFDPDCLQEDIRSSFHFDAFALRATGVREGTDFRLSKLEYVDRDDFWDLDYSGSFTVSWLVERYNDGYHLRSSCSGKYLDISNGRISEAGIKVQIWTGNNTAAQLWYFKKPLDPLLDLGDNT